MHPYTRALRAAVPEPSLEQRLDLTALMEGRASDQAAWPEPFRIGGEHRLTMVDLGGGHRVRAAEAGAARLRQQSGLAATCGAAGRGRRADERREGKECVSESRSRGRPESKKK